MPSLVDLTGKKFGRLTVLRREETTDSRTRWLCLHVRLSQEPELLALHSRERLTWCVGNAGAESPYLHHPQSGSIALGLVQAVQTLAHETSNGRAESPASISGFILPLSGNSLAEIFGRAREANAKGAAHYLGAVTKSTTSDRGLCIPAKGSPAETWLCFALAATIGAIPEQTPIGNSCAVTVDVESDYTLIPLRAKKWKVAQDGPRYKTLGNSMCTDVMTWIAHRIQMVESLSL